MEPNEGNQLPDGTTRRVLIIDDEATIRIAMRRFFFRMGWHVDEAPNGESGLDLLLRDAQKSPEDRFAIVLSDLRMPGINGIELYERLKIEYPDVLQRLVFSTGDIVSEEAASFVESTDCVVLQKPFELSTLRQTIADILAAEQKK